MNQFLESDPGALVRKICIHVDEAPNFAVWTARIAERVSSARGNTDQFDDVETIMDSDTGSAFVKWFLTRMAVGVRATEAFAVEVHRDEDELSLPLLLHIRPDSSSAETRKQAVDALRPVLMASESLPFSVRRFLVESQRRFR